LYTIKKTAYGLRVQMGGIYEKDEIKNYIKEKEVLISSIEGPYSMILDLRGAIPPEGKDATLLIECQERMKNLERMAMIITSPVIKGSAKQVLYGSGKDSSTRIINASRTHNWEELAIDWVTSAIEPDISTEIIETVK